MGTFTLSSPALAMTLVLRIGAVGVAISSLELLVQPKLFRAGGLLDAEVQLTRSSTLSRWRGLANSNLALTLVALRLLGACALLADAGSSDVARYATAVVAACILLLRTRTPLGIHASGGMTMVIFVAAALGEAVHTPVSLQLALAFICAQSCLAYFTAGTAKLRTPSWRDGRAIPLITSTMMWGGRREALLLRSHAHLGRALCWATICLETAFPLVLVLPPQGTLVLIACAAIFHLILAVEMGLNSFVWAFGATYPAVLYCWWWLHLGHH